MGFLNKSGIVILSRVNSSRVPNKPLQLINGIPLIQHLIGRCLQSGLPVCLAVPGHDVIKFQFLNDIFKQKSFTMFCGYDNDPLARMHAAMYINEWDYAVRVCHDKIFVDPALINEVLSKSEYLSYDYGILKDPIDGTAFEVIHKSIISQAVEKHKDVEHISYAIKSMTNRIYVHTHKQPKTDHRLLIDYPNDLKVLEIVLKTCGNSCTLDEAINFLDQHYWVSKVNRLPRATVYTCAYNAEKWISKCMGSVSMQQNFNSYEYLIIDDNSSDATGFIANKFCGVYKNSFLFRNETNLGLSSSSNRALANARGKYIIRLDADDYFTYDRVIEDLITFLEVNDLDAVYPNNHFGNFKTVQNGNVSHHVGGALFKTSAANHVKFTEQLRGYEGLDFFARAKDSLRLGYFNRPTFYYRQHSASLSKNNLEERKEILNGINKKYGLT